HCSQLHWTRSPLPNGFTHRPCRHAFPTRRSSDLIGLGFHAVEGHRDRVGAYPASLAEISTPAIGPPRRPTSAALYCRRLTLRYGDRKSTRLNSSHRTISYAVFCLKKKNEPRAAVL